MSKSSTDYAIYIAIIMAFILGMFVGGVLLPSLTTPPAKLIIHCVNNSSDLFETVKLARGGTP